MSVIPAELNASGSSQRSCAQSEIDAPSRYYSSHRHGTHAVPGCVRRQGFWVQRQPILRESLAHLVGLIMRRSVCEKSDGFIVRQPISIRSRDVDKEPADEPNLFQRLGRVPTRAFNTAIFDAESDAARVFTD